MMENIKQDSLDGLDAAAAKEYVFGFISALKLTEKEIQRLLEEQAKWEKRVNLASIDKELLESAIAELERIKARIKTLEAESDELRAKIGDLKAELRILPDKERSIDPDLLVQELLILSGRMPGDEKEAERERAFEKLEKEAAALAALEELKAKMEKQI